MRGAKKKVNWNNLKRLHVSRSETDQIIFNLDEWMACAAPRSPQRSSSDRLNTKLIIFAFSERHAPANINKKFTCIVSWTEQTEQKKIYLFIYAKRPEHIFIHTQTIVQIQLCQFSIWIQCSFDSHCWHFNNLMTNLKITFCSLNACGPLVVWTKRRDFHAIYKWHSPFNKRHCLG